MAFKEMRLKSFKEGDHVFKFGEIGQELYIILNGSVSVNVPTNASCDTKEDFFE